MDSSSKKKSKNTSNEKQSFKTVYQKGKFKTQPSPKNKQTIDKDKIKSVFKKINNSTEKQKYQQNHILSSSNNFNNNPTKSYYLNKSQPKDYEQHRMRLKSKNEIHVPNIRTSLTPKNYYEAKNNTDKSQQVHSTKNKDYQRFLASGRMDGKHYFQKKKNSSSLNSKIKEIERAYSRGDKEKDRERDYHHPTHSSNSHHPSHNPMQANSQHRRKLSPRAISSLQYNKDDESTIKINNHRDDDFDVRVYLTAEQYQKFGDRFPEKFKRVALLGRGGFSVVWLGIHRGSKKKIAIKQILTKNPHQTHLKEIWFGGYFFQKGGQPRQQFENHIGINNLCRLYYHQIKTVDTWLYYQVCEESLGSSLFELKGETVNGERNYKMIYKALINELRSNVDQLKHLIIEISKALFLMNSHNIVHSDLKTENILIKVRSKTDSQQGTYIKNLKLIDFGSSFLFTNLKQFSMATPQYMPPEILNYILYQNKLQYDQEMLKKMQSYINSWVVDVWSLGCIILQIISGLPLWMSIPTKIQSLQKKVTGLFAVKGRLFNKIIAKQIDVVQNLQYNINHKNYSGIKVDQDFIKIVERMLCLEPEKRISPVEILNYFGVPCKPQRVPFY